MCYGQRVRGSFVGTSSHVYFASFTLLGVQSWVRFCQQEFGEFPRPAWAVVSYSSGPPAGGTPQILVDKTSPMTGRLRVYCVTVTGEASVLGDRPLPSLLGEPVARGMLWT